MDSFFPISSETYKALDMWLDLLKEYDDNYKREKIVYYKSRRIQEKALNKNKDIDISNITSSNFDLDKSILETNRFNLEVDELHSIELVSRTIMDKRLSLSQSLEELSETIYDIDDEDDNIFDITV